MRVLWSIAIMEVAAAICLFSAGCSDGTNAGKCETSADCGEGQVCDPVSGKCRVPVECADLECAEHQVCREAAGGADAECLLECEEGWVWNPATEACEVPGPTCTAGAPGSILQECTDLGRECVEDTPGAAVCGDCILASQVLDPDTGICRDPKTCADIGCNQGEYCLQPPEGGDAYCSAECVGQDGTPGIVDPDGDCVLCKKCDGEGEDGPYLDALSGAGECICETLPGYYWQEGEPTGTKPCDRDGDGWVRFSAQAAIEHDNDVVRGRARCDLRRVDRIVLHNEAGQAKEVALPAPADLYESDRNDDQEIIRQHREDDVKSERIPLFPDGREPRAEELNGLTRACVTEKADYNDNNVEDILEWHEMDTTNVRPDHNKPLVNFTYYLELYRGWYEMPAGGEYGIYHVREKSRLEDAADGDRVPVEYAADADDYWRVCVRKRDAEYDDRGTDRQGMDFAWAFENTGTWSGMNHSSQFKCLQITQDPGTNPPPNVVTADQAAQAYQVNECLFGATLGPDPAWDLANPSDPAVDCTPVAEVPLEAVRWAAVDFVDYEWNTADPLRDNYVRGCVSECSEVVATCAVCPQTRDDCEGTGTPGSACVGLPADFGELFCGCNINFGGGDCEHLCEGMDPRGITDFATEFTRLFVEPSYTLTPRTGYWMCAGPVQTAYEDASSPVSQGGDFKLYGRVPNEVRATGQVLCQDNGSGGCDPNGFMIR